MKRVLVVLAASALLVSGCASGGAQYPAATAAALQEQVLEVTKAAADGELETALTRLDELTAYTKNAKVRGTVTDERHDSILSAIELVRADLEALVEKKAAENEDEEPAEEEPAPETGGTDTGNSGSGGGESGTGDSGTPEEEQPAEEAPVEEEPADEEPTAEPTEEPTDEQPTDEEPSDEEPTDEEPVEEEPVAPTPAPTRTRAP
jgi:hypothetical protein